MWALWLFGYLSVLAAAPLTYAVRASWCVQHIGSIALETKQCKEQILKLYIPGLQTS